MGPLGRGVDCLVVRATIFHCENDRQRVEEMLLASLESYRHKDGNYTIPGEFVVVAGQRP
jgi:hypothetical protein